LKRGVTRTPRFVFPGSRLSSVWRQGLRPVSDGKKGGLALREHRAPDVGWRPTGYLKVLGQKPDDSFERDAHRRKVDTL